MTAGLSLVVSEQGAEVGVRQGQIELRMAGHLVRRVRVCDVREILLMGRVGLTVEAVQVALRERIEVSWLTLQGRFRGRLTTGAGRRAELVLDQLRCATDDARRRAVAAAVVAGKLDNQRRLLVRAQAEWRSDEVARDLAEMRMLRDRALEGPSVESIRGLEGRGAALYWRHFGRLITADGFEFRGRRFRPPPDPINATLSFGYALLASACDSALRLVGLEPGVGFLHEASRGRPSLALDLMEELRPVVVDRVVVRLLNRGQLVPTDFEVPEEEQRRLEDEAAALALEGGPVSCADGVEEVEDARGDPAVASAEGASEGPRPSRAIHLAARGRKVLLSEMQSRFREPVLYPPLGTRHSLRDVIVLQARHLARVIEGEDPTYIPFTPR